MGFAHKLGLTFGNKRRVFTACGYAERLTPEDYRWRYERNEIGGRVIEAIAKATWRGGGELMEDEDVDTVTTFEQAWHDLNERLNVWPTFQRADILAGLGDFAVILIGAPGDLETPLETVGGPDQIVYLKAYAQEHASIETYVTDPTSPRFGQPEFYKLRVATTGGSHTEKKVHWTRCLHIADDKLYDDVTGRPRLQRVWNRIDDLEKVVGGGSEAYFRRVHGGTQFDLDPTVEISEADEKDLQEMVDEWQHDLRRTLQTRGMTIKDLGSTVSMFGQNVDALLQLISAGTGIPYRILTGSERGELASTQDKNNWNERVNDRRREFAGPQVVRPLVDRLIALGALPAPAQYEVVWPDVEDRTIDESAALAETMAKVNQAQGETVLTSDEIRDVALGLPPLAEVDPDAAARRDERDQADADAEDDDDDEEDDFEARAAARLPGSWQAIHKAADANRERVRAAVLSSFRDGRSALSVLDLETAFRDDNQIEARRLLLAAVSDIEDALTATVPDRLLDALVAGGRAAGKSFTVASGVGTRAAADVGLSFDATNPLAERWAREHASLLIASVTNETRDAVRLIIARAFREGIPPRQAARLIRPLIGLTEGDAQAVINARFKLLEATGGSVVKVGAVRVRIPAHGLQINAVHRLASQYADRLLRQRALTIARTETIAASNEGQRQLWLQAVEKGHLRGDELRTWITTPDERACVICLPMHGQLVGLTEHFTAPDGRSLMGPPAHPRCRCATGISAQSRQAPRGAVHVPA